MEEDRQGLPLGAPKGTVSEVSVRWLWKATVAVLKFLEDTPVGSRSSGTARANVDEVESVRQESEGEVGGPGPP